MKRRVFGLLCILALCFGLLPASAFAVEKGAYVALGDSISAGYGLEEEELPFPEVIVQDIDVALTNYSQPEGWTSENLLAQLQDNTDGVMDAVSNADIITITIGGNDLMDALYAYLAAVLGEDVSPDYVREMLESGSADLAALVQIMESIDAFPMSGQASAALLQLSDNLGAALTLIRDANVDATVVIVNQYNPYGHIDNPAAAQIVEAVDEGVNQLNAALNMFCAPYDVIMADAYGAFEAAEENPCDTYYSYIDDFNLDFHPNAYGHQLIALAVEDALPSTEPPFADVSADDWYAESVTWVWQSGYMSGYDDSDLFGVNDVLTRAQMATVLYNIAGKPEVEVGALPSDCAPNAWYAPYVSWALEVGAFNGYGDGSTFAPDDALTREQAACVIMNAAGHLGADISARADLSVYPDAGQIHDWATDAMSWAVAEGILSGAEMDDGSRELQPTRDCTRAEMAAILMNLIAGAQG